jgi:hypothetical protein
VLYVSNETGNTTLWVQDVIGGSRTPVVAEQRRYLGAVGTLSLSLSDEAGRPLAGRVMVLASDGRYYGPDDAWLHGDDSFDRSQQAQENRYFHCHERCSVTLPTGVARVWAMSGFGRTPIVQNADIPAAGRALTLALRSQTLPAQFGRYTSADLHVHMNYGGTYRQRVEGLAAQARAEDLDVVYNLIVNKEQRIPDIAGFSPAARQFGPTTIYESQEFHTSYWGHLGLLHLDDHVLLPDFASYRHTALASPYPYNGVVADLAHEQHALVGYVHPFDTPIDPEKEKTLSHGLPVDVALGKVDYIEIVSFADHRSTAAVWYRLLNLGYKLPAGAGTDAMTNYASLRGPVGLNRVFLATSEHTPEALKNALKQGHGFATNGPLLGLKVDGAGPGETVQAPKSRVHVETAVRSIVPLSDIELVFNGRVLKRLRADRSGTSANFSGDVSLPSSGWMLLRAGNTTPQTLVQDIYPYGTTNPVWIDTGTTAPAATDDARYFVRWIDRVIESASAREDYNTDEERQQTLAYLRSARAIYESKANAR